MEKSWLFFVLLILGVASTQSRSLRSCNRVYDVVDYGAIGDGHTDDTQAFKDAWKDMCRSSSCSPIVNVPSDKTFLLQPLTFDGEDCKPNQIIFQIDGKIKAPSDPKDWKCNGRKCKQWIIFDNFNQLTIRGSGTIDGQGSKWWDQSSCQNHHHHHDGIFDEEKRVCGKRRPTGVVISHSQNVRIDGLKFKDSPQMHMAFERSQWIYATNLVIQASEDSPNTDGIHLQHATNIFIDHTTFMTGDDCVSIGDGSSHINITNVNCGPGHGISIGSLGIDGKEETVEYVHVSNVVFTGTTNGARIKTWQGGKGYARHIVFENITSVGSRNPIIIDQFYCDHQECQDQKSAVKISDVTYKTIVGTWKENPAVRLACSESEPCTDIVLKDIQLRSEEDDDDDDDDENGVKKSAYCANVEGHIEGTVFPPIPCWS